MASSGELPKATDPLIRAASLKACVTKVVEICYGYVGAQKYFNCEVGFHGPSLPPPGLPSPPSTCSDQSEFISCDLCETAIKNICASILHIYVAKLCSDLVYAKRVNISQDLDDRKVQIAFRITSLVWDLLSTDLTQTTSANVCRAASGA